MNIDKLFFVQAYGDNWSKEYRKYLFIKDIKGYRYNSEFHREYQGKWETDHALDSSKYAVSKVVLRPQDGF